MSYQIDRSEPSEAFLQARNIAGCAIQEQFRREGGRVEPPKDYKWIKADLTWPSFDHLTFGYGNQVFSVLVDLVDRGRSSLTEQEKSRCVDACTANNLIPCSFKIDARNQRPLSGGWNLTHLTKGTDVIPVNYATAERIPMSEWELRNFAIQIVRGHIEKDLGAKVLSFSDVLGIDPQIWFEEKTGGRCWIVVRHYPQITGEEKKNWIGFEKNNAPLRDYDGFLGAVSLVPSEIHPDASGNLLPPSLWGSGKEPLVRGDSFYVKFEGLQRIYVS